MNEEVEIQKSILKFLIEKGPLWFVIFSVATNFLIGIKTLLTVEKEEFKSHLFLYLGLIFIVTLSFIIALILTYLIAGSRINEIDLFVVISLVAFIVVFCMPVFTFHLGKDRSPTSRKTKLKVVGEKREFDIQQDGKKYKITCTQNLEIKALENELESFLLFYPLPGNKPTKFKCSEEHIELNHEEISEYDGIRRRIQPPVRKRKTKKLSTVIWEYENLSINDNMLRTEALRYPVSNLEIFVKLPTGMKKPLQCEWFVVNGLTLSAIEEGDDAICEQQVDRYCIRKKFKKGKQGLSYAIKWKLSE